MSCEVCGYSESYFEPLLGINFCASAECWRLHLEKACTALQPVCKDCGSIHCSPRIDEEYQPIGHYCDECIKRWYEANSMPSYYCQKHREPDGFGECSQCKPIDFLYGGPIVVCEQCHKQVVLIDGGNCTGFAGGQVYFEHLSCGHSWVDESADIAAAY